MKTLLLVAFLAGSGIASLADNNLLKNGDFSSGSAHWTGDGHIADKSGADLNAPTAEPKGIVVKLRHIDWTKVMQDFDGPYGKYTATINYSVSPDFKLSAKPEDYAKPGEKLNLLLMQSFTADLGGWICFITDGRRPRPSKFKPKVGASGIQTISVSVNVMPPANSPAAATSSVASPKGFILAFPPGEGSITLLGISLSVQP